MRSLLVAVVVLAGCAKEAPLEVPPQKIVLVVNGRAVSDTELALRMKDKGGRADRDEALDALVTLELQAQKAEAAGLHLTPEFQAEMEPHYARLRDARRQRLARAWRLQALGQLPATSEREVSQWLAAHEALVGSQWRFRRISTSTRAEAEKALAALEGGTNFEQVAASFSAEPVALGPLGFDALPDAWWTAVETLQPGALTEPLASGTRFVVLQVVERSPAEPMDPAQVRARVMGALQARAYEQKTRELGGALREGAMIEKRSVGGAQTLPAEQED
jgi:predicted small lipoprotein YifL